MCYISSKNDKNKDDKMIDILLATYNGEKYLDLQLFSIVNQTYKEWNLYIHDDGSSDNTVSIIKKWEKNDSRIHYIEDDKKHLGPGNNFLSLIPYSKSDYVCFCDQDDFWFENKLEKYVNEISKYGHEKPVCILFSAYVWNENKITPLLNEFSRSINSLLFTAGTQGCSLVFNKKVVEYALMFVNNNIYLHDYLIVFISILFGMYLYCPDKVMLYRQHANNVTGHLPRSKIEKKINSIMKNKNTPFLYPKMYNDIVTIYNTLKNLIPLHEQRLFEKYISLPQKNKIQRFFSLTTSNFVIGEHSHLYFMIKYLMRKKYI